jgi:aminocarboxymuconate-semialdehyde decarboxylase
MQFSLRTRLVFSRGPTLDQTLPLVLIGQSGLEVAVDENVLRQRLAYRLELEVHMDRLRRTRRANLGSMAVELKRAIDVHHHWLPRELIDHVERYLPDGYSVRKQELVKHVLDPQGQRVQSIHVEPFSDVTRRLQLMDEAGIQVALLSPGCFPQWITLQAAHLINDAAADLLAHYGERLRPMVHVPPFGEPGILEEMERGARLGLTGVCMSTNFRGLYPDDQAYLPFLNKAAELSLPVFVHAAGTPVHYEDLRPYGLATPLGRSIDLCLVPIRLIYGGVLERIPNLKLVIAHLGGSFAFHVKRFFGAPVEGGQPFPVGRAQRAMDQLLFDTAPAFWHGPAEIEFALGSLGMSRVTLGSDYPHGHGALKQATDHVQALPLTPSEKQQIAGENLRRFYGL